MIPDIERTPEEFAASLTDMDVRAISERLADPLRRAEMGPAVCAHYEAALALREVAQ
jgi:hypothetical protein